MGTDKHRLKTELRSKIRAMLKNLSPEKRKLDSKKLCTKLKEQSFFQNAASILFFAPLTTEVDLWPLLEESFAAGKIIALPRFDPASRSYVACRVRNLQNEIVSGQFSICEPRENCVAIPPREIDLILVPGVAFDLRGRRLGRGKGYYDRLLAEIRGVKCAIAFDEQVVNEIPVEPHDALMDFILTPTRCAEIGR
ncbi:MAG: 5-formyltetrahydrofolate cyclo-ligase [Limisphaerales bacterium]